MRNSKSIAFMTSVLGLCLLIVIGNLQTAKAENRQTLEGEWVVTSTWTDTEVGGKFEIVRKGDGYAALFTPRTEIKGTVSSINIPYYGSPTQIMAVNAPSYEELVSNFKAQSDAALKSALRKLAGKVTQKRRITLSADGRTAEMEVDKLRVQYGSDGSLGDYKIGPFENKTVLQRVFPVAGKVESRGDRAYQADCGVVDPNRTTAITTDLCPGNLVAMTFFCGGGMGCPYVCCPKGLPYLNHCDCKCYATSDFDCHSYSRCQEQPKQ